MELPWLSRWQPQLLAILRIVVGLLFLEHALIKLAGFPPGGKPGLQEIGSFLWIAGIIELVTSVLVILGPFTRRWASIPLSTWAKQQSCSASSSSTSRPRGPARGASMARGSGTRRSARRRPGRGIAPA